MTCQNLKNKLLNITVLFIWYLLASLKKTSLAKHGEHFFILASNSLSTRHFGECLKKMVSHTVVCFVVRDVDVKYYIMSIYEILPALDLTQSVHAKISIGMHRGVKFKISRIPLIGLETILGWRTDRKFLRNPNLNEIRLYIYIKSTLTCQQQTHAICFL